MADGNSNHEYDESDVPDADRVEERHDYPDPAFDDVSDEAERPIVEGEDDDEEPILSDEDPAQLEADEQIDPEEPDVALPPDPDEAV